MREHVAAQIGDDALADGHDEVVARCAGKGEHRDDRDHHAEIAVDHGDAARRETEIDHPPHRDRHQQGRQGGDGERNECEQGASAVACNVGRKRQQGTQPCGALGR